MFFVYIMKDIDISASELNIDLAEANYAEFTMLILLNQQKKSALFLNRRNIFLTYFDI